MNDSQSQAPKERVNIAYKSSVGNQTQDVELPLKMLVLSDLTGRENPAPIEQRQATRIDKNNFDEVMLGHQLATDVEVPNTLAKSSDPGSTLRASLRFESLKDFGPERLCEQVEPLKALLELRRALVALKGPLGNLPAFRKKLETLLKDPSIRAQLLEELGANEGSQTPV
jgi:type VI secretion system protein ImpB